MTHLYWPRLLSDGWVFTGGRYGLGYGDGNGSGFGDGYGYGD